MMSNHPEINSRAKNCNISEHESKIVEDIALQSL